jgi:hypothetical protein
MESRPPIPQNIASQNISESGKAPSGYRIMQGTVPESITQAAKQLLSKPFGFETYIELDGIKYFFRAEVHYHPQGYVGGPNGWHKGITVYEPIPTKNSPTKDRVDNLQGLLNKLYS